jgi:hypothetical protein
MMNHRLKSLLAASRSHTRTREIRAHQGSIADMCGILLVKDTLDDFSLEFLAQRQEFPDAVAALQTRTKIVARSHDGIIDILQERADDDITVRRLAVATRLIPNDGVATLAMVSIRAASGDDAALMVLALVGRPHAPWGEMTPELRAAFLLGRLIKHARTLR